MLIIPYGQSLPCTVAHEALANTPGLRAKKRSTVVRTAARTSAAAVAYGNRSGQVRCLTTPDHTPPGITYGALFLLQPQ